MLAIQKFFHHMLAIEEHYIEVLGKCHYSRFIFLHNIIYYKSVNVHIFMFHIIIICNNILVFSHNFRVFPWLHEHVDSAHCIMAAFVACICTFHSGLPRAQPISLAWQFYLQHVAIGNQPLFILEVYHSEFAQLPWQDFLPQKEDLESMIKVSFKFNYSFISGLILLDI